MQKKIPNSLIKRIKKFEKEGFLMREIEFGKSSHFKVWFNNFPEFFVISCHEGKNRSDLNALSQLKKMKKKYEGC